MSAKSGGEKSTTVIHNIANLKQRFHWDCGVTCVMMLLDEPQRQEFLNNFNEICAEEGFHQSTWTIDLCYLLKRFGIPHTMYTTMMGVNENHKKMNYYSKIINLDRDRVHRRFASAPSADITVIPRALSQHELVRHLETGPAIVLVDAGLLSCVFCKDNKLRYEFRRWFGGGYLGHYILLVGVSGGLALYRSAARAARCVACGAKLSSLEAARAAPGTDGDVILIHRNYK